MAFLVKSGQLGSCFLGSLLTSITVSCWDEIQKYILKLWLISLGEIIWFIIGILWAQIKWTLFLSIDLIMWYELFVFDGGHALYFNLFSYILPAKHSLSFTLSINPSFSVLFCLFYQTEFLVGSEYSLLNICVSLFLKNNLIEL